jgi:hypothetical protein
MLRAVLALTWHTAGAVAQVVAASAAVVVAALVAWLPHHRRPKLSLKEDPDRIHSRVEADGVGYVRLLVANAPRKRTAPATRVQVVGYREQRQGATAMTSLTHPLLGWPSAPEAVEDGAMDIFAGGERAIGLGRLIRAHRGQDRRLVRVVGSMSDGRQVAIVRHSPEDRSATWFLALDLAFGLDIIDDRDKLEVRPDGYTITLLVGADDGDAQRFEVDVNWNPHALDSDQALASLLDHLAVRAV